MGGQLFIGTSGYSYTHWRETFYPKGLPQSQWLQYYATRMKTVELNVSFYRLPSQRMFEAWRRNTPEDFQFAVKGWGLITHRKYMRDCEEQLKTFLDNAVGLEEKLSVIFWQLPPQLKLDMDRLRPFLQLCSATARVRQAVEFRNPAWYTEQVYDLLRECRMSLVLSDMPKAVIDDVLTTDFVYVRRHGPEGKSAEPYTEAEISALAGRVKAWSSKGNDVYVYFNNDYSGHAAHNAEQLLQATAKPGPKRQDVRRRAKTARRDR